MAIRLFSTSKGESVITRKSAEDLALKRGDEVTVVVKSTEVILQRLIRAQSQHRIDPRGAPSRNISG